MAFNTRFRELLTKLGIRTTWDLDITRHVYRSRPDDYEFMRLKTTLPRGN